MGTMADTLEKIEYILTFLFDEMRLIIRFVTFLSFFVEILFVRIFLYDFINSWVNKMGSFFGGLSEAWKIAITMMIVSVPIGIITIIVGHFSTQWIEARFKKFLKK